MEKWSPLAGKVPVRVEAAIRRAYKQGRITKPLNELTDKEILSVRNIWVTSLQQIREVVREKY